MELVVEHPDYSVVDDFLDEETWGRLWTAFQFLDLAPVTRTRGAWKLDDGIPLGGQDIVLPRDLEAEVPEVGEHEASLLPLMAQVLVADPLHGRLLQGQWDRIAGRPWVYPQGTGLSWHVDDHELYAGAFIYYAHPAWNAHWGGELLIGETDPEQGKLPVMGHRFETEPYSEQLLDLGHGSFVMPKPNRLILLGSAPHMVTKVSAAAGHNVRATVAGFFLRPDSTS